MGSTWLRRLFPAPMARIPSVEESKEREARLTKEIVQQHAEGSVLLAAGRFEMPEDLFAEEEDTQGGDT